MDSTKNKGLTGLWTGARLKELRQKANISMNELSKLSGIDRKTLAKWEREGKAHEKIGKAISDKLEMFFDQTNASIMPIIRKIGPEITQKAMGQLGTWEDLEKAQGHLQELKNDPEMQRSLVHVGSQADTEEKVRGSFTAYLKKWIQKIPAPYKRDLRALYEYVTDEKIGASVIEKAMGIGALLYFVTPFDGIIDSAPFIGFIDDWAVIAAAVSYYLTKDSDKFKQCRDQAQDWLKENGYSDTSKESQENS